MPFPDAIRCRRVMSCALVMLATPLAARAQTTNLWVGITNAASAGSWTNTANWSPADVPDSTGEVANFTAEWTANASITLDGPTTLNGIIFNDVAGATRQYLTVNVGSPTGALSFGGTSPFVNVVSGGESQPLTINAEVDYTSFTKLGSGWLKLNNLHSTDLPASLSVSQGALWLAEANSNLVVTGAGFTKSGGGQLRIDGNMTLVGGGDITANDGRLEVRKGSTNFTGNIIVNSNAEYVARGSYLDQFGDTNGTTTVNGNGARAKFQDPSSGTIGERFILNGFKSDGSLQMDYANVTLTGPITLNTNSHININTYNHSIRHTHISGAIDDGAATNGVTLTIGLGGASPSGPDMQWTNYVTQSRMILSGASTYGGNTYISARTATTHASNLTFTVELTNGNNRLPTSTVVYLGGQPTGIVGSDLASGRLLLNGVDQELAGLATLGSGTNNRVVAGAPTVSTLTINAASNQTYTFGGSLGGPNPNEDNLVLIKRGLGTQILSGASTYTGQTIVAAGVLHAAHSAALGSTVGNTVVSNGAQLRLSGNIAIDEELTLIGSGIGGSNLGALRNVSGSNTVNGPITFTGGVGGRIQAAGDLLINGGVTSANLSVMFAPFAGASITVSNAPIDIGTATLQAHDPGTFNLNASGNVMGTFNPAWTIRANIGAANALPTNVNLTMGQYSGSAASAGQGTLDMNGFDVTVGQLRSDYNAALTNPSNLVIRNSAGAIRTLAVNQSANSSYDGRLIENIALLKDGAGTLNLGGANTYAGTTVISNGTVAVNGFHLGGGQYTVAGGSLGGTGLIDAAVHVLAGGVVAPGNSIGTLTVSNSFDLDGVLQIELANAAAPGAGLGDLLDVNGFFDITNGTVQFIYTGTMTNDFYVFAEYDSLSGNPFLGIQNLPDGYSIDYAFGVGGNQIALVIPEPSTMALLALGFALVAGCARRRGRCL